MRFQFACLVPVTQGRSRYPELGRSLPDREEVSGDMVRFAPSVPDQKFAGSGSWVLLRVKRAETLDTGEDIAG
jgi:hypothetical protein